MHSLNAGADQSASRNFNYREYLPKAILSMTRCTPYPEYDSCLGQPLEPRARVEANAIVPDRGLRLLGMGC